ncbi:MGH1-like glycoside hydrolase domain-containing protein [Larkinella harenae]
MTNNVVFALFAIFWFFVGHIPGRSQVLNSRDFKPYVDAFNRNDDELYRQEIPNAQAWEFLSANIPLFECPDKQLEQTYYFRWWTYRKHIKATPDGFVITEFLPAVPWAGKHNTISCPAAHHFYEGRWLHDNRYLKDYARFWFRGGGNPLSYSFWAADAISRFCDVHPDTSFLVDLLPDLITYFQEREKLHRDSTGLYWQVDDRDGMEVSVSGALGRSGQGYRATINSYQYGDAKALADIARLAGQQAVSERFARIAASIQKGITERLWDSKAQFYKVIPRGRPGVDLSDARELHGFTPWYFNIPPARHSVAWAQLMDPQGFGAPYGPTSVEQRHPGFQLFYTGHECQWNGPTWPFATAVTLTALANYLNNYPVGFLTKRDYWNLVLTYSRSHQRTREDGVRVPWMDENLNPYTGDWISRTRLSRWDNGSWSAGKGGVERGKDYNHSTFCDLIISGLIGIRAQEGKRLTINPLVPESVWDYFCLDHVLYHGQTLTVLYDKTGEKYGRGKGFRVLVNQREVFASDRIQKTVIPIP